MEDKLQADIEAELHKCFDDWLTRYPRDLAIDAMREVAAILHYIGENNHNV